MMEEHKLNRPRPVAIIQAVSSIAMADTILLSKSLGIPPPLPPREVPQEQMQGQQQQGQRKSGPRYVTRADPNPYDHPKFWRSVIPPKNWIGSPIS